MKELLLSRRAAKVAPFLAMDVLAAAAIRERNGDDILHMEIGQPASSAPRAVLDAAKAALSQGKLGYTEALGWPPLRERIARHYAETYNVDVPPDRVVVTTGSSAGFVLAFLGLFDEGARIAISAPGYPAYRNILSALGLEPVPIALRREDGWAITASSIAAAHAARSLQGVLVMSPANPSGMMIDGEGLSALAGLCRLHDIRLISDEIYHGLTYRGPAETVLAFDPDGVVINSFSKYYAMTGWRVGWMIVPHTLSRGMERLAQSLYISPPTLSQIAAIAAFEAKEELEALKSGYAENRALLMEEFPKLGLGDMHPVDGAFYIYADVSRFTADSVSFCSRMLQEIGIAATPGMDFDPVDGSSFVRFSFAQADCQEAVRRLKGWLS